MVRFSRPQKGKAEREARPTGSMCLDKKNPFLLTRNGFLLVGVQGFEPRKCLSQSQVPYRLATPQYKSPIEKAMH